MKANFLLCSIILLFASVLSANLKQDYNNKEVWKPVGYTYLGDGTFFMAKNRYDGSRLGKDWCAQWEGQKWGTEPYDCRHFKFEAGILGSPWCGCKRIPISAETCIAHTDCKTCCQNVRTFKDWECCIYFNKTCQNNGKVNSRISLKEPGWTSIQYTCTYK